MSVTFVERASLFFFRGDHKHPSTSFFCDLDATRGHRLLVSFGADPLLRSAFLLNLTLPFFFFQPFDFEKKHTFSKPPFFLFPPLQIIFPHHSALFLLSEFSVCPMLLGPWRLCRGILPPLPSRFWPSFVSIPTSNRFPRRKLNLILLPAFSIPSSPYGVISPLFPQPFSFIETPTNSPIQWELYLNVGVSTIPPLPWEGALLAIYHLRSSLFSGTSFPRFVLRSCRQS